jgi:diketogulonate reductase-like aldo/keto reductase
VLHGPYRHDGNLGEQDFLAWSAMQDVYQAGKTKNLGISNFDIDQLHTLLKHCHEQGQVKPRFLQNRCYARTRWDAEIRKVCKEHDIIYQGFSLLTANVSEVTRTQVKRIAQKYDRTIAQIVFNFCRAIEILPITGTSDPEHMSEDLMSFDFELTTQEIETIELTK